MAKYCLKKPSKRMSCAKRHKIEKKVREHNRKQRKESRNKGHKSRKGVKLVSVPNKCPFKEQVLAEAEKRRDELKEEKAQRKLVVKANAKLQKQTAKKRQHNDAGLNDEIENTNERGISDYVLCDSDLTQNENAAAGKNVKAFSTEVRRTIESADVVIEVLDARDPLGSRSRRLEELVLASGKRLVLLLNKIDLVPKENVLAWLAYLRGELPAIAFKASTQDQQQKLGRYKYANLNSTSSKCIGADLAMKLLNNYCRSKDIKTSIRVGIVGFPNVGKSSVINSLKRKKACNTGSVPGLTRQMQEVELDKHIRLIDSPGVVLATRDDTPDATELALRNALRIETLADPQLAVDAILRRCAVKVLMLHYNLPEFDSCDAFLALISRRLGKLKKGGRPDIHAAAKHVLNDWNSGKLRYHTQPPESISTQRSESLSSEIVSTFSKEFDLDALDADVKTIVDTIPDTMTAVDTVYDSSVPIARRTNAPEEQDDDDDEMEDDSEDEADTDEEMDDGTDERSASKDSASRTIVTGRRVAKKRAKVAAAAPNLPEKMDIEGGNAQMNRAIRAAVKKYKKRQKKLVTRADKLADHLSSSTTGLNGGDVAMDDYDFNVLNE